MLTISSMCACVTLVLSGLLVSSALPVPKPKDFVNIKDEQYATHSSKQHKEVLLQKITKDLYQKSRLRLISAVVKMEQKMEDNIINAALALLTQTNSQKRQKGIHDVNELMIGNKRVVDLLSGLLESGIRKEMNHSMIQSGMAKTPNIHLERKHINDIPHNRIRRHDNKIMPEIKPRSTEDRTENIHPDTEEKKEKQRVPNAIENNRALGGKQARQVAEEGTKEQQSEQESLDADEEKENGDNEEEEEEEEEGGGGQGGLLGIFGSLSGGEGMSDIGAFLAAVTGIVSSLLGEGGIDIPATVGGATSLLGGLLGNEKENLGATFAGYLTTAVEGFTGGGAVANGNFFGSFLAKLVSQLSVNGPENDPTEGPVDPGTFIKSLLGTFAAGSSGGDGAGDGTMPAPPGGGGSDLFGFVGDILGKLLQTKFSIVKSLVGVVTGVIAGSSGAEGH